MIETAGFSHPGRVRVENEDSWTGGLMDAHPEMALIAVADGMGGHAGGGQASACAIAALVESVNGHTGHEDLLTLLSEAFRRANQRVFSMVERSAGQRPGTTLTAALVCGQQYVVGHVGDSRAYLISAARILQLTEDQSWVAEQVRLGLLRPDQAHVSPHRSRLVMALGTQPMIEPFFYEGSLGLGDSVLICSDGVWDAVEPIEVSGVIERASSLDQGVRALVDLALSRGGEDNITAAALRYGVSPARDEESAARRRARAETPIPASGNSEVSNPPPPSTVSSSMVAPPGDASRNG